MILRGFDDDSQHDSEQFMVDYLWNLCNFRLLWTFQCAFGMALMDIPDGWLRGNLQSHPPFSLLAMETTDASLATEAGFSCGQEL